MKKWHFILLVLFALSLMPNKAFACGDSKKSCKKEMSDKKVEKNCCCTGDHTNDNHKGCNGKCGHSSCVNPVVQIAASVPALITIHANRIAFSTEKPLFFYNQPRLSSGYYTIWLIPKISLS